MWGEIEIWGEIERSPALAAPSFNDCVGLTATSTNLIVGEDDEDPQAANDLCVKYLPLARSIAAGFTGRGIHYEDLYLAGRLGLVRASRKFDPDRGAFGPYARPWIKGEITRLFKPAADAMAFGEDPRAWGRRRQGSPEGCSRTCADHYA
jgi:DNA-directed RNA polymerase sigma subunit (sigma70/sigma32)